MFIIDDILLAPLKGVIFIGEKINEVIEKEMSDEGAIKERLMALQFLEEKIEDFKKEAQRLNQEIQAKGFYLEYSGPWPAYNFTTY